MAIRFIKKLIYIIRIFQLKNNGLQLGKNSVFIDKPNVGSEPFLVKIKDNVTVSSNVQFVTHDGATRVFRNKEKYKKVIRYGRIIVEDNCFLGLNSIIMPGVKIGPNSIVGSGSIVTRDVPPNTIYAGNPAKYIMTVSEYAEKTLLEMPEYDIDAYKKNKKKILEELYFK